MMLGACIAMIGPGNSTGDETGTAVRSRISTARTSSFLVQSPLPVMSSCHSLPQLLWSAVSWLPQSGKTAEGSVPPSKRRASPSRPATTICIFPSGSSLAAEIQLLSVALGQFSGKIVSAGSGSEDGWQLHAVPPGAASWQTCPGTNAAPEPSSFISRAPGAMGWLAAWTGKP